MNDKTLWQKIDEGLPRLWKTWLFTALVVLAVLLVMVSALDLPWLDRLMNWVAKVPLVTIGVVLGYYADRALFRKSRIDDLEAAYEAAWVQANVAEAAGALHRLMAAYQRRALIVAACVIAVALAA